MPMRPAIQLLAAILFAASPSFLIAQAAERRPLTQDTYDSWRTIQGAALSPDGKWAAYTLSPVVGDGELVVRATGLEGGGGATEYRLPRGFTGRPRTTVADGPNWTPGAPRFANNSRFLAALTYASQTEFDKARASKRGRAAAPKSTLSILSLASGQAASVPGVKSFALPSDGGSHIVFLLEPDDSASVPADSAARPTPAPAAAAAPGGEARPVADSSDGKPEKKETGSTLVVRELGTGAEVRIEHVLDYETDEHGKWVAYSVSSPDGVRDGAYVRSLRDGNERSLLEGTAKYLQFAFDEEGERLAFVSDRADSSQEAGRSRFTLYHVALPGGRARPVVDPSHLGGDVVSGKASVRFTKNGSAVLFGVGSAPLDSIPADSLAEMAVFDLWHYRDARLQPQQKVEANRDSARAATAIYHVGAGRLVRLENDSFPDVEVSDDGRVALAVTDVPYQIERTWGEGGSDVYVQNALTGERKAVAREVEFGAALSPAGKYVVYFDEGRWFSYDVARSRQADLTGGLEGVGFERETWDTPSTPAPWGIAGWTEGDASVLLYDRYDVWDVDPSGERAARMVTDSAGRRGQMVFRLVRLDPDEPAINPSEPLLFRVMNEKTKASGFWRDRLGARQRPESLLMADREFGTPSRARDSSVYLLTQSTVSEFPDLWVGPAVTKLTRITDANPQQSDYSWAGVELVEWVSVDGVPLQGLLYKPEGFDPARKYPMVVYFYEQLSDGLHSYRAPTGRNVINPMVYASLGYLAFFPDIAYREGYPGQSALQSIVPGVLSLVERGFVDPSAIGAAGQSWGGYQLAYMITQTGLFKAAVANAPVANMTSAYGGIRWESGRARSFQYEKTQSRIGGTLWEFPMRYIENSPLFYADRVETPVLMMHNDGDGAVPWYQGIEMFVALRRLGKEAYLINYNGDAHNPRKRANQKDIDMRMQQFFDHHLRGAPAPDWMVDGIPFQQKGRDRLVPAATATAAAPGEPAPANPEAGAPQVAAPVP